MKRIKQIFYSYVNDLKLTSESIANLKSQFLSYNLTEGYIDQICAFFFKIKFEKNERLNLTEKSLGQNNLVLKLLFMSFIGNSYLKDLDLSVNFIGDYLESIKFVKDFFSKNTEISKCNFCDNNLGLNVENLKIFSDLFKYNTGLKIVNLSGNSLNISSDNFMNLAEAFKMNETIEILSLKNNQIGLNPETVDI